ncbi:hypothetical protein RND81_06G067300 [Saponaria officinalis]|uniref:Uncharacterized protein n=1 Tax=Saponaria officinalis TaxID=3572 RepID=A0AAW1K9V1_SAPOF
MGSIVELLLVASMPVLKFMLISALGIFLALKRIDILGPTARHHLNQMVFYVFGPALVCSYLAQTVTLESFLTMWFMPINILLTFVIGSALGWVLAKLTGAPKYIQGLVVSSCSAGNLGAMPIIIIPAICKQRGNPFGAENVCNKYGLAYASLSMAIGTVYIWLYIYNIVRISTKKEVETTDTNGCGNDMNLHGDVLLNIPENERLGSSEFTDASPVIQLTSHSSEEHDGKTSVDAAERIPSTHPKVAASKDHVLNPNKLKDATTFKISQGFRNTCKHINLKAVLAPSTIAAAVGFFIGMISPIRKLLFGDDAPLHVVGDTAFMIGDASIPSITLILGANLLKGLKKSKVKLTIILGIIVVRYIFLPLLGILIVKGAVRAGFVQPHDLLLQFVSLLQYALPPALTIGTITQLFGESETECAVIMLWTYAAAPVTFTLWSAFFLWLVSH